MNNSVVRIVRMTFQDEKVPDFLELFELVKNDIKSFKGCKYLELLKDTASANVYTSYSVWDTHESLENYRSSDLFHKIWKKTRSYFITPATAHSYIVFSKA
jgi:heme-degrading monooxygenase HmoA